VAEPSDLQTARAAVEAAIGVADIILPSTDDLRLLYGDAAPEALAARLWRLHAREIALTTGPEGCLVVTPNGRTTLVAPPASVVDTSGAGDSFNGAYLAARLAGAEPEAAAEAGLAVAARVVSASGAIVPIAVSHPKGS
jgi:2-dehydro-3-deoxygluconokinase